MAQSPAVCPRDLVWRRDAGTVYAISLLDEGARAHRETISQLIFLWGWGIMGIFWATPHMIHRMRNYRCMQLDWGRDCS